MRCDDSTYFGNYFLKRVRYSKELCKYKKSYEVVNLDLTAGVLTVKIAACTRFDNFFSSLTRS